MNILGLLLSIALLNIVMPAELQAREAPELEVTVFLATRSVVAEPAPAVDEKRELEKVFRGQGFRFFYRLKKVYLSFDRSAKAVLNLPSDKRALFTYQAERNQHYLYSLSLPEYDVKATLRIPLNRTFYQAGIKHNGGTLLLKIRALRR